MSFCQQKQVELTSLSISLSQSAIKGNIYHCPSTSSAGISCILLEKIKQTKHHKTASDMARFYVFWDMKVDRVATCSWLIVDCRYLVHSGIVNVQFHLVIALKFRRFKVKTSYATRERFDNLDLPYVSQHPPRVTYLTASFSSYCTQICQCKLLQTVHFQNFAASAHCLHWPSSTSKVRFPPLSHELNFHLVR